MREPDAVDSAYQLWWNRPLTRTLLRAVLATAAAFVIAYGWSVLLTHLAWRFYPNPSAATKSAYVWVAYRPAWIGIVVAILVGGRIWPRWGVVAGAAVALALAQFCWTGGGVEIEVFTGDPNVNSEVMGDRWSAVFLVVAAVAAAVWSWRCESLRRRQRSDKIRGLPNGAASPSK